MPAREIPSRSRSERKPSSAMKRNPRSTPRRSASSAPGAPTENGCSTMLTPPASHASKWASASATCQTAVRVPAEVALRAGDRAARGEHRPVRAGIGTELDLERGRAEPGKAAHRERGHVGGIQGDHAAQGDRVPDRLEFEHLVRIPAGEPAGEIEQGGLERADHGKVRRAGIGAIGRDVAPARLPAQQGLDQSPGTVGGLRNQVLTFPERTRDVFTEDRLAVPVRAP